MLCRIKYWIELFAFSLYVLKLYVKSCNCCVFINCVMYIMLSCNLEENKLSIYLFINLINLNNRQMATYIRWSNSSCAVYIYYIQTCSNQKFEFSFQWHKISMIIIISVSHFYCMFDLMFITLETCKVIYKYILINGIKHQNKEELSK